MIVSREIRIVVGGVQVRAELDDTPTAEAIASALPVKGSVNRWGGEIYFAVPVDVELEGDAREVLEAGELAYWPPGKMFCVFFGTTPASRGEEIRAASAVNVFGRVTGDLEALESVPDGGLINVALASERG
jgi:hypothetical protein